MSIELKKIRDCIANEENAFSIGNITWEHWSSFPEDSYQGICGTPACILGWDRHLNSNGYLKSFCAINNLEYYEIIMPGECDELGHKHWALTTEWFTRKRTVAMLDHLIDHKEVNWFALENKGN